MGYFNEEFKIVLYVEDYQPALFFYREALGLLPNYTWNIVPDDNGARFYLAGAKLELVCNQAPAPQGRTHFMVQSTDVDKCFSIMSTFPDIAVVQPPTDRPYGARSFVVQDPAGNLVEVMQYQEDVGAAKQDAEREDIFDKELTVLFYVKNLEKSRAFYEGLLGLEKLHDWDAGPTDSGVRYKAGRGYVELLTRKPPKALGPGMVSLEADNVNICFSALKKKNAPVLHDIRDVFSGQRLFRLTDPDGNVVEIYSELEDIRDLKVAPAEA